MVLPTASLVLDMGREGINIPQDVQQGRESGKGDPMPHQRKEIHQTDQALLWGVAIRTEVAASARL